MNHLTTFKNLLTTHLLPEYCDDPRRQLNLAGFRESSIRVSENDAYDFLRAWDACLILHIKRGLYRAPLSKASEQFFWTGPKAESPQKLTLWLEPVITVGILARLHFDFGWPRNLIGTQSTDWAFDVVAHRADCGPEHIACEVKKTTTEIDHLVEMMQRLARAGELPEEGMSSREKNAYRKLQGLRARRAPVFWAAGPDRYSKVFKVSYGDAGKLDMSISDESALAY